MANASAPPPAGGSDAPAESREVPLLLPGAIGAELSRHTATMQAVLQQFAQARHVSRAQMATLKAAVEAAHQIAMQTQQISRLAGGRLRQSHERLSLDELVRHVLQESAQRFHARGMQVQHQLRPVEVIVDPGLLLSLVEAAVAWSAERGRLLQIRLTIKNWPEHGVLDIKSREPVEAAGAAQETPPNDTLSWFLLLQLAHAMGVVVDRVVSPGQTLLMVEFPRTVKHLEGLTAVEVDTGSEHQSSYFSEVKPLAGHRLLLITADEALRAELRMVCTTMGLVLDSTPTTRQAVKFCELDKPQMIVIDERLRDRHFSELREDLLRHDVNFPFVEIANGSNIVEMSSWMGDSMSRISRDSLKTQLPSILVMELSKVI